MLFRSSSWLDSPYTLIFACASTLPLMLLFPHTRNRPPYNLLLLFTLTFPTSLMVSFACLHAPVVIVVEAGATAILIFLTLTFVALFWGHKIISHTLEVVLGIGLMTLIGFSVVQLFVVSPMLHSFIAWSAIVLFCGYILYDTSLLAHSVQDPVEACLCLYLDGINLFLSLLEVLNAENVRS